MWTHHSRFRIYEATHIPQTRTRPQQTDEVDYSPDVDRRYKLGALFRSLFRTAALSSRTSYFDVNAHWPTCIWIWCGGCTWTPSADDGNLHAWSSCCSWPECQDHPSHFYWDRGGPISPTVQQDNSPEELWPRSWQSHVFHLTRFSYRYILRQYKATCGGEAARQYPTSCHKLHPVSVPLYFYLFFTNNMLGFQKLLCAALSFHWRKKNPSQHTHFLSSSLSGRWFERERKPRITRITHTPSMRNRRRPWTIYGLISKLGPSYRPLHNGL